MIAEFYGLPGSGKTTIVRALIERNGEAFRAKRKTKSVPVWQRICLVLTPEFMGYSLRCLRLWRAKKVKWKDDGKCVRMMLKLYLVAMHERKREDPACYCVDHGMIQCILALIWTEMQLKADALALADYILQHMGSKMTLVYTANEQLEKIYQRIVERGESRRITRLLTQEQGMELLRFQMEFFDEVDLLAQRYNMGIRVNTAASLDNCVESVQQTLRKEEM